jgi:hypothetical protein
VQEVFVQRKYNRFEPISQGDEDKIKDFPTDKVLRLKVYGVQNPRSLIQLNLFWACCKAVSDNTEDRYWDSKEKVAFQVKVALNFVNLNETIVDPHGNVHFKYRSISFKELPHMEATKFFDRAFEVLAAKLNITVESLLENSKP